jgi:DNA adenine methylase
MEAKPFLKWAGGKSQLLDKFARCFPKELKIGKITHYYEPFLGGGAVFFRIVQKYGIHHAYLSDINPGLIELYKTVRTKPLLLFQELKTLAEDYLPENDTKRAEFFYARRKEFNILAAKRSKSGRDRLRVSALMIFLNRTCYNGLFRMNSRGEFNAPHGDYVNPGIANAENILAASGVLRSACLRCVDFKHAMEGAEEFGARAFVYFDPPYRPLSKTANFTAYSGALFGDKQQEALCKVFKELHSAGVKVMLSNSDPKNQRPDDDFFDKLYAGFNIRRVPARRMINSKAERRGHLNELVITNY